ncbi:MAG TPA: hypothetical protein VFO31_06850 [Vicinamibacterales bacterium]|nr:hypothetical protein [Vicinamibacterales bacterium]
MATNGSRALCFALAAVAASACGPLRLDGRPQIHGSVVSVQERTLSIRHKTGYTYDVALTPETRILRSEDTIRVSDLCPGQRAVVILSPSDPAEASEVRISGGPCP